MSFVNKHRFFLIFFGGLYVIFFFPLLTLQQSLLKGDYETQFYPWMYTLWEALSRNTLPLWTPLIHCGFPLFAEGQTAMLYLPNLLLFKFLPFHAGYNALFLTHYFAGAYFFYRLCIKNNLSYEAAALAACVYTFGSAQAGGFYGAFSLRPMLWFPLSLYLVDSLIDNKNKLPIYGLALAQGQAWLAGYPQMTAYAFGFTVVYYLLKAREKGTSWAITFRFVLALVLGLLIALPQIWATLEWAAHSTRTTQDSRFSFWGAAMPWSLLTLFMYSLGDTLKTNLYIGIIPLILALTLGGTKKARIWWILAGLGYLMALGPINPFYALFAHLPGFSLFRNPSKFLFFSNFFLILVSAVAYDRLMESVKGSGDQARLFIHRGKKWLFIFTGFFAGLAAACYLLPQVFLSLGRWYAERYVIGKSFHRHSSEEYLSRVSEIFSSLKAHLSILDAHFWLPFAFLGAILYFVHLTLKHHRRWPALSVIIFVLTATDLFAFGYLTPGKSFVGNVVPFSQMNFIETLPEDGRYLDLRTGDQPQLRPNRNMLTGHSVIGAYSPLIDKDFYQQTKQFGMLDDSFGRTAPAQTYSDDEKELLNFLGVKYIYQANQRAVVNAAAGPEFSLLTNSLGNNDAYSSLHIEYQDAMHVRMRTLSSKDSLLMRNVFYDPGWKVKLDGRLVPLLKKQTCFQAVQLPKGGHEVFLFYRPDAFYYGGWVFLLCFFGVIAAIIYELLNSRWRGGL